MEDIIIKAIELAIAIVAFLIGRYLLPKIKDNMQNVSFQFGVLLQYAESFCAYARQFLNCSGSEKMDDVVSKLKAVCDKYGIEIDEETLRAIGQKAYDSMIAGEKVAEKVIITEATPVEETKTVEETTAE